MTDPVIPNAADAIGQGINALVALRPAAVSHIDSGTYGNVFAGWRAQQALLIARLADEVAQSRLATAYGDGLRQLVASEFDVFVSSDGSSPATGIFQITRTNVMKAGTIPRGSRIRRLPVPTQSPPVLEATYQATEDVYLQSANYTAILPVVCTAAGSVGNYGNPDGTGSSPYSTVAQAFQFIDTIFDPTVGQNLALADIGGGADATTDVDLRRFAGAMAIGRYAPTVAALIAYAFSGLGVRRAAVFEDTQAAVTWLQIADGSRGGSSLWASQVAQHLQDVPAVGFGCRVIVTPTLVTWVNVQATIVLRDSNYANFTTAISNNVRAAVDDYFTNRDDFLTFKNAAVRGRIARADPRILTCTSVTVTTTQGVTIADPPAYAGGNPPRSFYRLASNGVLPTYVNPS